MDAQENRVIRESLQSTREALIDAKHAIEGLLLRVNRIECDVNIDREVIDTIKVNSIRSEEQLNTIKLNQDRMTTDLRAIRNSVASGLITAAIISFAGLALTGFGYYLISVNSHQKIDRVGK
jgi:hypothetical protein